MHERGRYVGPMRTGTISRSTKETSIDVTVNLDGTGLYTIETGIGFLGLAMDFTRSHGVACKTLNPSAQPSRTAQTCAMRQLLLDPKRAIAHRMGHERRSAGQPDSL